MRFHYEKHHRSAGAAPIAERPINFLGAEALA
jgi:hypothetical protein